MTTHPKERPMPHHLLQELLGSAASERVSDRGDAIVVDGLAKRYPNGTDAVRGISFHVAAGEVFGILGPNGAGKSTTMGMLGTLVRPTGGWSTVAGYDVAADGGVLRRDEATSRSRVGTDPPAAGVVPGRTDRGPGPARPDRDMGDPRA